MTFRLRHLLAALVLHAVLIGVLVTGVQCSRQPVRPPVIQAVLLDPSRQQQSEQRKQQQQRQAEAKRRAEQEQKRREAEARRKIEQEQQRREAEAKRRQAEAQQRREQEEEARRQKELAERKKAEEEARRKQEEEERRERQEQAKRELQEQARLEEELRREAMAREVEREAAARAASEREAKVAEWALTLERHIQKNWVRPAATLDEFQCTVRVQQLPDGTVTLAKIQKSCGNAPLDKSVEDAVYRASPLPRPGDPSIFERDLIINFVPK